MTPDQTRRAARSCHRSVAAFAILSLTAIARGGLVEDLRKAVGKLPHANAQVGACIIDLRTGQTVFTLNADQPLTPASTMKLFAMSAALNELGPVFEFQTVFAFDGKNLIVIGDGDPGFGDEKIHRARGEPVSAPFDAWADALRKRGITDISGDLIIDEWVFDDQRVHPTWERNDLGKWYAAPVSALNINDNCLDIVASPAKPGEPARISVQPENSLLKIVNKSRSGGKGEPTLHHPAGTLEYTLSGRVNKRWPFSPVAFPDPAMLFADSLKTTLARQGIAVRGQVRRARVRAFDGGLPSPISIVGIHHTSIAEALARAGKDSQNLFAECLLKRAGYAHARRMGTIDARGSWSLGASAVDALMSRAGIKTDGLRTVDGSGLSRDNACTARQLAALLAYSHTQPTGRLLHDSLAKAGVDGSLRKRLRNSDGRVFAKTGTMRGIRSLAGYVDDESGPRYAFAVMFNGYSGPSIPYKEIQDRICRMLAEAADNGHSGTR